MHRVLVAVVAVVAALGCNCARAADLLSDAPEERYFEPTKVEFPPTYVDALRVWKTALEINQWIGARFEYDPARAMRLSETQRSLSGGLPIHKPDDFFSDPRGICVDLSRFAVETLRTIAPHSRSSYLMIEFAPLAVAGNTLRRHWLAMYVDKGSYFFFADSKRPGHVAGPYQSITEFIDAYAKYSRRQIISFRELDSFQRKTRNAAGKQPREARP